MNRLREQSMGLSLTKRFVPAERPTKYLGFKITFETPEIYMYIAIPGEATTTSNNQAFRGGRNKSSE